MAKGLCDDGFNCAAYEMGGHLPIKGNLTNNCLYTSYISVCLR